MAQNTDKINQLNNQLEDAKDEHKASLYKQFVDIYSDIDENRQIEYALKIVELPDHMVDRQLKRDMYNLLSNIYKAKSELYDDKLYNEGGAEVQSNDTNYVSIIVFALSLITLLFIIIQSRKNKKIHQLKLIELEARAENIYNEKYEKLKAIDARLEEKITPLREELRLAEDEETELKKKLKNLEEANYLKSAFLSNMSHEIRTSLNGINGFANILETELALMAEENLYAHAQNIQQSGSKLENLLTNIIEISRLEANVVEKEIIEHPVQDIITAVENANTFKANEKGLIFKSKVEEDSPKILADAEKLKKVLNVLIDNAIKYTSKGFVTISSSFDEKENNIRIDIRDTGDGIEKEYAELIEEAFKSDTEEHDKSYQGIGIGLKLSKKFIELMDGSIRMSTVYGKGSHFSILLPATKTVEKQEEADKKKKAEATLVNVPQLGKLDIFIVEDDRMNRMVLEKMLKNSGTITTAVDGDDAMKLIIKKKKKGVPFHVMLFDINLPAPWDGTRLMQEVRRTMPEYNDIPFIAQTAYAMAGDKNRFLEAGFDDYIAKPIVKNELLTLIEKQLAKFSNK